MPPLMSFFPRNKTPKHKGVSKPKSESNSKSDSSELSTATKNRIATFTRKKDMQRLFKKVKKIQETKKKVDSFTRKRDNKNMQRLFKKVKKRQEYQQANECSICLQTTLKPIIILQCEHIFHKECLKTWLINKTQREQTCPLCRTPVTSVDRQSLGLPEELEESEESEESEELEEDSDSQSYESLESRNRTVNIYRDRLRSQIQIMLPQRNDLLPLEQRYLTPYEQSLVFYPTHLLQIPRIGKKQLFVKIHELHVQIKELNELNEIRDIISQEFALMEQIVPLLDHLINQQRDELPEPYSEIVPNLTLEEAKNIERLERIICDMARRLFFRARDRYLEYNRNRETRHNFFLSTNNQLLRNMYDYTSIVYSNSNNNNINRIVRAINTRLSITNTINRSLFGRDQIIYNGDGWPIPRPGEIDLIRRQVHDLVAGIIPLRDPRGIGVVDSHYNDRSDDMIYEIINDIEDSPDPYGLEDPDIHANGFDFSIVPNHYQSYRPYLDSQNKIDETRFADTLILERFDNLYD
jgi:hypothetical protein